MLYLTRNYVSLVENPYVRRLTIVHGGPRPVKRSVDKDDSVHYQELDICRDGDYENITLH